MSGESEGHVRIFDTTLRDGEQSPGASMTASQKLEVADAPRSDPAFLPEVRSLGVESGARTITGPDRVGSVTPDEYGALIAAVRAKLPREITISVHCHDDLGLATANTIAGLRAGARQCE